MTKNTRLKENTDAPEKTGQLSWLLDLGLIALAGGAIIGLFIGFCLLG